ncbi:hypothetical protein EDI_132180, partial [Entamoeba dispar SAW760]
SFFIYFFPTSQFTLTKIPPKCDLVIQYSYHYEINDQMKNTIINSLNQKPYFIFQCIHPNKFYDDPFVMLNYNDLPLLQNGLFHHHTYKEIVWKKLQNSKEFLLHQYLRNMRR